MAKTMSVSTKTQGKKPEADVHRREAGSAGDNGRYVDGPRAEAVIAASTIGCCVRDDTQLRINVDEKTSTAPVVTEVEDETKRLLKIQDACLARKAEEIQGYAERNESDNFFVASKTIYEAPAKGTALLLSSDGSTLLTEKLHIPKHWVEHFSSVLNHLSTISDAVIDRRPQVEVSICLDCSPSIPETASTLQRRSSEKAPGSVTIPTEIYKYSGHPLMDQLTALFQQMWRCERVPQDFIIVHLY
ncbi:hypothetical protein SprV_0301141100 [Sparganum proliferum]